MTTTIDADAIFSGAPVSLMYGGVECGSTITSPKVGLEVESGAPAFKNAGGPVKGTRGIRRIMPTVEVVINELTAQKLAWAMPGATASSSESVGQVRAGLDTTLAADPALGATNLKVASVTTVDVNDFIRVGAAGVAATELNSEVVQVLTVGTIGGGGTGLDIQNDAGGGMRIDHANGAEAKTVTGTLLAAPAAAGATNVKVDSVTGLAIGDFIRVGYLGHFETRVLTAVGTAGAAGTGLTFAIPLTRDHALDEWVIEVTALGGTTIRPVIGRLGASAYADLVLTDVGADGRTLIVTLENATSAESQSLEFDDDPANPLGLTLKFTGHYAEATPTQVPITFAMAD
jgi:hypothetical protein